MQDVNRRIARKLRAIRGERGLSLETLAEASGVSRSMLSVIERGESSPTAVLLDKIATGLGITLATLFDDVEPNLDPLSRGVDRVTWKDPGSGYVRRNLSPQNYPSPLQLVEVVLPAGARVAYDAGPREPNWHQQIWMLEGAMELTSGNDVFQLAKDDCLAMRIGQPTVFHNRRRVRARYVVALTRA